MGFDGRAARRVAERLAALLAPGCERVEIAGSIRRGAAEVKDVELVVVPKHQPDLFGGAGFDLLNETLRLRCRERELIWRGAKGGTFTATPDLEGRRFYSMSTVAEHVPVDIFAVRAPAQWGAIFAIRTGPAEYAKRLVTSARAQHLKCEDGRLVSLRTGDEIATPTEEEFIAKCGLRFTPPHERR